MMNSAHRSLPDITLMLLPCGTRGKGIGLAYAPAVPAVPHPYEPLDSLATLATRAVQDSSIEFGRPPALATCHTGPIWLAVHGCATSALRLYGP